MPRHLIAVLACAALALTASGCATPAPRPSPSTPPPSVAAAMNESLHAEGWTLSVDKAALDADTEVAAANEFNPEPGEGEQYALVQLTLTQISPDADPMAVDVALVIAGEKFSPAPAAAPGQLNILGQFEQGTPVRGALAFLIPEGTTAAQVHLSAGTGQSFLVPAP